MSEEDAAQLLENRVRFKLYAAEQHLKDLKNLEQHGSTMQSFKERVHWEVEIECFLFHILGVRDSLLHNLNDKLALKLNEKGVNMSTIRNKLTQLNEQRLLTDLENLNGNNVFRILKDLRNQSTHRKLINVLFRVGGSDKAMVFFVLDPNKKLEVIPFLEDGLKNVKTLVQSIMDNESRLR